MAMTKQERAERKADSVKHAAKMAAIYEANRAIVCTGKCPECGCKLKANLSITGWYMCEQSGAVGFRKDASKPSCSFDCFTR